jgi:hypothetical protein
MSSKVGLVSGKCDSQFSANRPDHRSPRRSKSKEEESCEDDHSSCCLLCILRVLAVKREVADGREDEEADEHPAGAGDEGFAASVMFYDVEAVEGDAEVDAVLEIG